MKLGLVSTRATFVTVALYLPLYHAPNRVVNSRATDTKQRLYRQGLSRGDDLGLLAKFLTLGPLAFTKKDHEFNHIVYIIFVDIE